MRCNSSSPPPVAAIAFERFKTSCLAPCALTPADIKALLALSKLSKANGVAIASAMVSLTTFVAAALLPRSVVNPVVAFSTLLPTSTIDLPKSAILLIPKPIPTAVPIFLIVFSNPFAALSASLSFPVRRSFNDTSYSTFCAIYDFH
ncbi:MAG: hypothetical protein BWY74_01122 [Firmicutes bacterium ADurb.Bin419]|nr:MAG: hypothetical protein BWY74_01122 [Firmicutes bacterium ADurb.Bin419]